MDSLIYSLFVYLTAESGTEAALIEYFHGAKNLFEAGEKEWQFCSLISSGTLKRMKRTGPERIEEIIRQCEENDWHIITRDDGDYPAGLGLYQDSPGVLFVSGNPKALNSLICVCGTRHMDAGGEKACRRAADAVHECGRRLLTFDTPGCDAAAARDALVYGNACMALAGGLDRAADRVLASYVESTGAVVSVFAPSVKGSPANYHIRNRFVSRLCEAAIITQASENGNSLYVASRFHKEGKPVFAAAGSAGCDRLLNDYAHVLRAPIEGVLISGGSAVRPPVREQKNKKEYKSANNLDNLSQNSIIVFNILKQCGGIIDTDELFSRSGLQPADVMGAMTELELYGIAVVDAGNRAVLL